MGCFSRVKPPGFHDPFASDESPWTGRSTGQRRTGERDVCESRMRLALRRNLPCLRTGRPAPREYTRPATSIGGISRGKIASTNTSPLHAR